MQVFLFYDIITSTGSNVQPFPYTVVKTERRSNAQAVGLQKICAKE